MIEATSFIHPKFNPTSFYVEKLGRDYYYLSLEVVKKVHHFGLDAMIHPQMHQVLKA